MSKLEVDAVEPQSGTSLTLGASGDTITIPSGAIISNQGTATGFGPTGAVSWDVANIKTTGFTAVNGLGYFCNTTSSAFTVTLPATPSAGNVIAISDYAATFATNNITVDPNGNKIAGSTDDKVLNTNGIAVTLVYVDSTEGWLVTDSGLQGDLVPPSYSVDYLVVAGGGSGANVSSNVTSCGGGGGAGGMKTGTFSTETGITYTITVGDGGAGISGSNEGLKGNQGSSSSISGGSLTTVSTTGGGGGGAAAAANDPTSGGSGGGGGDQSPYTGASGVVGEGNSGGNGNSPAAGGGGGKGAAGQNAPSGSQAGAGGAGGASSITGSSVTYAGGGAGGSDSVTRTGGTGGGGNATGGVGGNGTANTGGGAGGGGLDTYYGGDGGKVIVVISLPKANYSNTRTGSPTVTESGGNKILQFTGSGSYTT
jgi:hypothetical protein